MVTNKEQWKKAASIINEHSKLTGDQLDNLSDMIDSPDDENYFLAKELLRLKISDVLIEGLNVGQSEAFLQSVNFFREDLFDAVVLRGYAGTGKSFMVKRLIEYISNAYPNRKIAITAPTNKAVHVLADDAPFGGVPIFETYGVSTDKIVYSTVHKLMGLKEKISNKGVQSFETDDKNADITKYSYLFVDEVSMLPDNLFHKLMAFSHKVKIIFMGDPAQIPPINKLDSAPLQDEKLFEALHKYKLLRLGLTEIMRQKGDHPIVNKSMILRSSLLSAQPLADLTTSLNSEGNGIVVINSLTQRKQMKPIIGKFFTNPAYKTDTNFIKMIAWKNDTVNYLNGVAREFLFGTELERFVKGESLIANKPLWSRDSGRTKWGKFNVYLIKGNTSDEFKILNVRVVTKNFSEKVKTTKQIKFSGSFWELLVQPKSGGTKVLHVIHESSAMEYNELLKSVHEDAAVLHNRDYWVLYFNIQKWSDNVTYNYAITVHKAQGSTYENVIFIEEDVDKNWKIEERNRIKYTAYTRAIRRLYVLKDVIISQ